MAIQYDWPFLVLVIVYIWSHKSFKGEQVLTVSETLYNEMVLVFEKEDALIQRDFNSADSSKIWEKQERNSLLIAELLAQLKFSSERELYHRFDSLNQVEPMLPAKLIISLPQETVKKQTWFWFYGNKRYLEVLFWAMFGVICSLLFNVTQSLKTNELDLRLIPDHIAKLFYGPVVALVIYFSFDKVSDTGLINIVPEGLGLVVLSFILGFFSRRSMAVLNKLKKLVVPTSDKKEGESEPTSGDTSDIENAKEVEGDEVAFKELETAVAKHKEELIEALELDDVIATLVQGPEKNESIPIVLFKVNRNTELSKIKETIKLDGKTYPTDIVEMGEGIEN